MELYFKSIVSFYYCRARNISLSGSSQDRQNEHWAKNKLPKLVGANSSSLRTTVFSSMLAKFRTSENWTFKLRRQPFKAAEWSIVWKILSLKMLKYWVKQKPGIFSLDDGLLIHSASQKLCSQYITTAKH